MEARRDRCRRPVLLVWREIFMDDRSRSRIGIRYIASVLDAICPLRAPRSEVGESSEQAIDVAHGRTDADARAHGGAHRLFTEQRVEKRVRAEGTISHADPMFGAERGGERAGMPSRHGKRDDADPGTARPPHGKDLEPRYRQ